MDESIRAEHHKHLQSEQARAAYAELLESMVEAGWTLVGRAPKNGKKDVHFVRQDGKTRPYSFIVNRNDLTFYFRASSLKPSHVGGLTLSTNDDGEIKVKLTSVDDVKKLLSVQGLLT